MRSLLFGRSYVWTRFIFQRALAFIYLIAFLVAAQQFKGLLGSEGLLPARLFVSQVSFWQSPSIFFAYCSDALMGFAAWLGVVLALAALFGISERFGVWVSALIWFFLWALYLSFVNIGQVWYSFGWETMLCEAGFLAIFLGPAESAPPAAVMVMFRWLLFRVMFGAGLIKLRGDACWSDFTCLQYHFETQPVPNAFSPWFHQLPAALLKAGVAINHFVELVAPFGYFISGPIAAVAGLATIFFQLILVVSGNLSFLNFLTIVLCIPCFDDSFWIRWTRLPKREAGALGRMRKGVSAALTVLVIALSVQPAINLFSDRQIMNTSFEPLHLVNTYGAFGNVTRERNEVIIEGTRDALPLSSASWKAYEFYAKPGDPMRRPPFLAPYHRRLDWLMWFAAMGPWQNYPWFVNLTAKFLQNDPNVLALVRVNPFADAPPKWVRATLYRYRFTSPEERRASGAWWVSEPLRPYFPAVSLEDPDYRELLKRMGWLDPKRATS